MAQQPRVQAKERTFSADQILLSTTDTESRVTYANPDFCEIAGYSSDELVGQYHNLVRHPDMPRAAFADLWRYLKRGRSWMGIVKNRCKNGDYYYVNAFVTPITDASGNVVEYQSVRTKPDPDVVQKAEQVYAQLRRGTSPRRLKWPPLRIAYALQAGLAVAFLSILGVGYFSEVSWLALLPTAGVLMLLSLFTASIGRRLSRLTQQARDVFDNPLMQYIYTDGTGDLHEVELALRMQSAQLMAILGRVRDSSGQVAGVGDDVAHNGRSVSDTLAKQHAETDQVATASEELSATIRELAQNTAEVASAARDSQNVSDNGKQDVSKLITSIRALAGKLKHGEATTEELNQRADGIGAVLEVIRDIADQTNLLALNAAIEAARAGENGRGFAVVADEVRALARRTQDSTDEIQQMIAQLHNGVQQTSEVMMSGVGLSDACVSQASTTEQALEQIAAVIDKITDMSTQNAAAVEEQATVVESVTENIHAISQLTDKTTEKGLASIQLSEQLMEKLQEQQRLLAQFKR